jgi:hypothetical protein
VGIGSSKNNITLQLCIDDLADNITASEANNKTVLWLIVLVLGLSNKSLALIIISFTL